MAAAVQMPAVAKKKECMPKRATNDGKNSALNELVAQFANVTIDIAEPRTRVGKISGVTTQITAQIDSAIQPM